MISSITVNPTELPEIRVSEFQSETMNQVNKEIEEYKNMVNSIELEMVKITRNQSTEINRE